MDKIMEEMKAIPIELRTLRLKKSNLEMEVKKTFNEKIRMIEEVGRIRTEISELKNQREPLQQEIAKKQAEAKGIEKICVDKDIETTKRERALDNAIGECTKDAENLNKRETEISKRDSGLKEEKRLFYLDKGQLANDKAQLKKQHEELENKISVFELEKELHQDDKKKSTKDQQKIIENLDKSNALKASLEESLIQAEEEKKISQHKNNILDKVKANHLTLQKDLQNKIQELDDKIDSFESKEKEQLKKDEALDNKEKEIKIKGLRVEKLIRDKGVTKELKDLEKELQGK